MPTVSCGMKCSICGVDMEFYVHDEEEECSLLVNDSYVCEGCQEVLDRAEMERDEDSFDAWVEAMEEMAWGALATASDHLDSDVEHADWVDLQQTLNDARY